MRGDRIGIVGPNGCGKTTLIKLLMGELEPSGGSIYRGTSLKPAYFDQQRDTLDPAASLMDNVTGGSGDTVTIDGRPRHVSGYLRDFLFPPERLRAPVSMLSGGERNRLLLAKLFARPSNLLIMDEPTNDLDAETLDLVEEMVARLRGHVAAGEPRPRVSRQRRDQHAGVRGRRAHRRVRGRLQRLDAAARERGKLRRPLGRRRAEDARAIGCPRRARKAAQAILQRAARARDHCPAAIERLEAEQAALQAALSDPALFRERPEQARTAAARLQCGRRRARGGLRALGRVWNRSTTS